MLLFLDFDGVLHPDDGSQEVFCCLPLLESWMQRLPAVQVVISSSWRSVHSMSELVEFLGPVVGPRVVGCTPVYAEVGQSRGADPSLEGPRRERDRNQSVAHEQLGARAVGAVCIIWSCPGRAMKPGPVLATSPEAAG